MPPVDPRSYRPRYLQVADHLREEISSGRYRPGDHLPSERELGHIYGVGSMTARRALVVLRGERLIVTEQGVRARVREQEERTIVQLDPGDRVVVRAATADERRELNLGEGTPVAEVTRRDGHATVVVPAFDVEFRVNEQPPGT